MYSFSSFCQSRVLLHWNFISLLNHYYFTRLFTIFRYYYFELIGINYTKVKPRKTNINLRKLRLSHLICIVWKESFRMGYKDNISYFSDPIFPRNNYHFLRLLRYCCCFLIHICWLFIWFACFVFNLWMRQLCMSFAHDLAFSLMKIIKSKCLFLFITWN